MVETNIFVFLDVVLGIFNIKKEEAIA